MNIESIVTIAACLVVAATAPLGIFSEKYKDTLLQRVALGGMGFSSIGIAYYVWRFHDVPPAFGMFMTSVALWSVSIVWKYRHGGQK